MRWSSLFVAALALVLSSVDHAPSAQIKIDPAALPPPPAAAKATIATNIPLQIGVNSYTANDSTLVFADAYKQSRQFGSVAQPYNPALGPGLDAQGWPKGDCGLICATAEPATIAGRYAVRFTGQATLGTNVTAGKISARYDRATNTTHANYDVNAENVCSSVYITFTHTRRRPNDRPGTGITNLQIMRPLAPGSTKHHDFGEVWDRRFLQVLAPFPIRRTMDEQIINAFPDGDYAWSARTLPADPNQSHGRGIGMAIEYMIALANARPVGQNLWFSVPDTATDDFIVNLGLACKYGTDGVDPYTGPPGASTPNPVPAEGPKWPPLRGKPYFEYSNECWNDMFTGQVNRMRNKGKALAARDREAIAWDGLDNIYHLGYRYYGLQVLRMRKLLDRAFGAATFNRDFFVILANQLGDGPPLTRAIEAIGHNEPGPVNQVVSLISGGWYASWNIVDPKATPDEVCNGGFVGFPWSRRERSVADPLGIPSGGYEGNLNIGDGDGRLSDTPLARAVDADPRIGPALTRVIQDRLDDGLRVLMVFNTDTRPWAIAPGNDISGPKFRAAAAAASRLEAGQPLDRPAATLTFPAIRAGGPAVADHNFETAVLGKLGNAWAYTPTGTPWTFTGTAGVSGNESSFTQNNLAAPEGEHVGFLQNLGSASQEVGRWPAGRYTISLAAALRSATKFPRQSVEVLVDDKVVGTLEPTSVHYAIFTTPTFAVRAGAHRITLRGTNNPATGDFSVFIDAIRIAPEATD